MSLIDIASSWSWVTKTVVIPNDFWISLIHWRVEILNLASRFDNGSSISKILGFLTIARAMATRCCWPPDNLVGFFCKIGKISTLFATSKTSLWIAFLREIMFLLYSKICLRSSSEKSTHLVSLSFLISSGILNCVKSSCSNCLNSL